MQIFQFSQANYLQKRMSPYTFFRMMQFVCKATPYLEQVADLFPLTLRELAWLIAICENGYSYPNIPWEFPALKGRVDGLESVFIEQINLDIRSGLGLMALP